MANTLNVQGTEIIIIKVHAEDYICLTDMLKAKDGDFFVTDWLRNRNTLEYIGIWEKVNNPDFNYGEFATIRNNAGLNNFKISVKEFVERTGAICLQANYLRYHTAELEITRDANKAMTFNVNSNITESRIWNH